MCSSFFVTLNRILAVQTLFLSSASFRHFGARGFTSVMPRVLSTSPMATSPKLKPLSLPLRNFATKKPHKTDLVMRSKSYGDFYEGKSLSPAYYPKSENQKVYYAAVNNPEIPIVLGVGAAGTGKTLFALTAAINALKTGKIQKIVLTRPIVPVDEEELGFLPGDLKNKMAPWTQPMFDIFLEYYSKMALDLMVKEGIIEISPLAFMRGRTFKKCFVIADEMQNSSPNQMMMLTTRIGTDTRLFITGDLAQTDRDGTNGLTDFVVRAGKPDSLVDQGLVKIVNFGAQDVERSMIVNRVVEMYNAILHRDPPKGDIDGDYNKTKKPASNDCALIPKEHISENIKGLGNWDIGKLNF